MTWTPETDRAAGAAPESLADIGALLRWLLQARRPIARTALLFGLVVGLVILARDRTWTAGATLLPQSSRMPSSLGGLAAQFGVAIPSDAGGRSPEFFAELATSRVILDTLLTMRFPAGSTPDSTLSIEEAFDVTGATPALRRNKAIEVLQKKIRVHPSLRTGTVRLTVSGPDARFVTALVRAMSDRMVEINIHIRREAAAAERQFASARLAELELELQRAEQAEEAFLITNRDPDASPRLSAQRQRLTREADRLQQVVNGVRQVFEQARLDEFRDTPPLLVLDPPVQPERPERRGLLLGSLIATILGALVGLAWVIVTARLGAIFGRVDALPSVETLWAETRRDLRQPWRLLFPS